MRIPTIATALVVAALVVLVELGEAGRDATPDKDECCEMQLAWLPAPVADSVLMASSRRTRSSYGSAQ
jgi:hypothetical protein